MGKRQIIIHQKHSAQIGECCSPGTFLSSIISFALRNWHLNTTSVNNQIYLNVEQKVEFIMEFILSMQAAGSSAQSLAIISAMLVAITFAGGSYREQSREDITTTKRFAATVTLVNSAACFGALISLLLGVMVIIKSQSIVSAFFINIGVHNDPPGQGNDFNNNNIMNDQNLMFARRVEIMLRKWFVIVSSLLILFSTVLLVIGEVLDLLAIARGRSDSLDEFWFILITYPIYTALGVALLLWIRR